MAAVLRHLLNKERARFPLFDHETQQMAAQKGRVSAWESQIWDPCWRLRATPSGVLSTVSSAGSAFSPSPRSGSGDFNFKSLHVDTGSSPLSAGGGGGGQRRPLPGRVAGAAWGGLKILQSRPQHQRHSQTCSARRSVSSSRAETRRETLLLPRGVGRPAAHPATLRRRQEPERWRRVAHQGRPVVAFREQQAEPLVRNA